MLELKITEEELQFMEDWFTPQCLAECIFSNSENLALFNEEDFIEIRLGQIPLLSGEYIIDEIPELSEKENFGLRENVGDVYCLAGRLWGKTWTGEKIDICEYILCMENEEAGFSSFDALHIRGVLEVIINVLEHHPIISLFRKRSGTTRGINRHPSYLLVTEKGVSIEGVNMNLAFGIKAGDQFCQKHFKKLWIEEASKENEIVYEKRVDSRHEMGCVERLTGMTNFTEHSPVGKLFFEPKNKSKVMNVPQYINFHYDEQQDEKETRKYGGKQSVGYRVFVKGEVIREGISALNMELIRKLCYPHLSTGEVDVENTIKNLEVNDKSYGQYRAKIIVERPSNVERLGLASDIGEQGGTTEVIVMGEVNRKWRYLYNITLRNLTNKQQYHIFKFLYQRLNPDFMAFDVTDGSGRAIVNDLEEDVDIDKKKMVRVNFNENIETGIETDNEGNPIRENGKIIKKYERTDIWSVQRLCHLLYEALVFLPFDYKLDEQFDKVIAIPRGNTIHYVCASREDHLWQAFMVFSILHWLIEYGGFSKLAKETVKRDWVGV